MVNFWRAVEMVQFTYVRRSRLHSDTACPKSSVRSERYYQHYQNGHVFNSKTKHEPKNTILLCEQREQRGKKLHIRPNCSVQCLRYFFFSLLILFYPNVALVIELIGTKENTLMHTMPEHVDTDKKNRIE